MASVLDSLNLLNEYRKNDPSLNQAESDVAAANLAYAKTGDERLRPIFESSTPVRWAGQIQQKAMELGGEAEEAITPFAGEIAGKTARNIVSGLPGFIPEAVTSVVPFGRFGKLAFAAGSGITNYMLEKAASGDNDAAMISGLTGALLPTAIGRVGKKFGAAGAFGAGLAGSVGELGAKAYVANEPTAKEQIDMLRTNPSEAAAFVLGQAGSALIPKAASMAKERADVVLKRRAAEAPLISDEDVLLNNNVDFQNVPVELKKTIAAELKSGNISAEQAQRKMLESQAFTNPEAAKKLVEFDKLTKDRDAFLSKQQMDTMLFNERELAATFNNQLDAYKVARSVKSQAGLDNVPDEQLFNIDPYGKVTSVTQNDQFNKALIDNGFGYLRQETDDRAFKALAAAKEVDQFADVHAREFKLMAPKVAQQMEAEATQLKRTAYTDLGIGVNSTGDDVVKSILRKLETSSKNDQQMIMDSLPTGTIRYLRQFAIDYPKFHKASKLTDVINENLARIDKNVAQLRNMNRIDLSKASQMMAQNGVGVQQNMDDPYLMHMAKADRDLGKAVLQTYGDQGALKGELLSAMGKMWAAPNMTNWFHLLSSFKAKTAQEVKGLWSVFGEGSIEEAHRMLRSVTENKQKASRVYDAILNDQALRGAGKPVATEKELKAKGLTDDEIKIVRNGYNLANEVKNRSINSLRKINSVDIAYLLNTQTGLDIPQARKAADAIYRMAESTDPANEIQNAAFKNQVLQIIGAANASKVNGIIGFARAKADEVRQYIGKFGQYGYMPMTRRGRWFVEGFKGDRVWANAYDSKADAQKALDKLASEGWSVKDIVDKKLEEHNFAGVGPKLSEDFIRKNSSDVQNALKEILASSNDPEALQGLIDDAISRVNDLAEAKIADITSVKPSFKTKYLLERNGAEGFRKEDFLANLMDYSNAMIAKANKNVARAEARLERQNAKDNPNMYRSAAVDENYSFGPAALEFENARKYAAGMTLAGSMKNMLQNLTQPLVLGVSTMAQRTGRLFKANEWFAKANALNAKWVTTGTTGNENLDMLMKRADADGIFMSGELERLLSAKEITDGQIEAQDYVNRGAIGKLSKSAKDFIKATNRYMLSVGEAADVVNRRTSALMDFQRSLESVGNRKITEAEAARMVQDARKFVIDVNFTGDKAARPTALKMMGNQGVAGIPHALMSNGMTLMNFVVNALTQLSVFAKQAYKQSGGGVTGLGKMWTTNYGKAVLSHMMYTAGLSGALGMIPFSQDIINIIESVDKDIKINKWLRQTLVDGIKGAGSLVGSEWLQSDPVVNNFADTVMGGAPGLLGADSSMSLGYGSVWNYNSRDGIPSMFGVTGDLIAQHANALAMLNKEGIDKFSLMKFARMSAPKAISQFVRIADMADSNNYLTSEGKPVLYDQLGLGGQAAVMAGFVPMQVTNQRNLDAWNKRDMDVVDEQRKLAVKKIGQYMNAARLTGDVSNIDKARSVFNEFMAANPFADASGMINSVAKEQQSYISKTVPIPGGQESIVQAGNLQAFPGMQIPIQGQAPAAIQQGQTAWAMGQPQIAQNRMRSIQQKAQKDAMVQSGLAPALVNAVQNPRGALSPFGNPQDMARMGALSELEQGLYNVR